LTLNLPNFAAVHESVHGTKLARAYAAAILDLQIEHSSATLLRADDVHVSKVFPPLRPAFARPLASLAAAHALRAARQLLRRPA
jgi:hypothetical protein